MIHKVTIKIKLLLGLLLIFSLGTMVNAQSTQGIIKGTVTDIFGKPLSGVIVNTENEKIGTSTDILGAYSINVSNQKESLVFILQDYLNTKVAVAGKDQINIQLQLDVHKNDEVIQLGYTSQLRKNITGSVASVSGTELERSPVANLTQSFAGRFAGLTTQENYSELSRATTSLSVRGLSAARGNGPLVMIDGIISAYNSNQILEYISANEIETVTVLKDASTEAIYGILGANGLIVVTTKRGKKGGIKITGSFNQSMQQVTTTPTFYSAAAYAKLRNEAAFNDGQGLNSQFSDQQIARYAAGDILHPNNNWYKQYIKPFAAMQRAGVNIAGGNDKVQFFSNINVMHQEGQFITSQPKYNPNANNVWINYRSNVDMLLNKYLKAFIRLSGNIKRERSPGAGNNAVYTSLFQIPPTMYGPLTPQVLDPATGDVLDPGGKVVTTERGASPTFGLLNRTGYVRSTVTNITSQFGLDLDMGFLTKGLSLTGAIAYQTNSVGSLSTTQNYERWVRTGNTDTLSFTKKGSETNSPLAYNKTHSFYYHLTYNSVLSYNRNFGKHQVGGMGYMFYQNLTKADNSSPGLLPYNRVSSGAEATYGYDSRFLFKFDVGYSGSEQYARSSRFIATPAVAAAWVLSNEAFMKDKKWLSNLKLRVSYGKTANDQSGLPRFAYLDNITVSGGGPIGYLQYNVNENQVGNPNIQAEVSTKQNYGVDLGLFNAITISVDIFKERMNNMVVSAISSIPLYQGVPLGNYPQINSGAFQNKGYEITANYTKAINRDFSFSIGAMYSYAKNTLVNVNEAVRTEDYAYKKWQEGYACGQQFGYQIDYKNGNGLFNTQAELNNSNLVYGFGTPRLGDLVYKDLNKDGKIDERDMAPIGTGALPLATYALVGNLQYKAFGLNFLFQGVSQYSSIITGDGVWETSFDGLFGALHQNAWTEERYANGSKITSPALSLAQSVNHVVSDYYQYNRSYIRLKDIELSYTLPAAISKVISTEKIRFVLSAQNLVTWDKMKSKDFGPEGANFTAFPVYRVYNAGVNIVF